MNRLLVIGSGGREHSLVWHLKNSGAKVFCSPGSDAIAREVDCIPLKSFKDLGAFSKSESLTEIIVGPEKYLSEGIADELKDSGVRVFGPTKSAARLESDKSFAKNFCERHSIPTAKSITMTTAHQIDGALSHFQAPYVVKASGLAQGKGVWIGSSAQEAKMFGVEALKTHTSLVVEEFLNGEEISYFTLVDGEKYLFLGAAQDHKRLLENDHGPNTGGMGAHSPTPALTEELRLRIESEIVAPVIRGLKNDGIHYRGFIFFGLMVVEQQPYVLEFNCRLGDPETQSLMMRLETPLIELIEGLRLGTHCIPKLKSGVSLNVVLAARGYPDNPISGFELSGIDQRPDEIKIFHSGTKLDNGSWIATGGRLVSVNTFQKTLVDCQNIIYPWIESLSFLDKVTFRRDVGVKAYRHLKI